MNSKKAAFFDSQADAPWADACYGRDEMSKQGYLLKACRVEIDQRISGSN